MNMPLKLKCHANFSFNSKKLYRVEARTDQNHVESTSVAQTQLPKTGGTTYNVVFKTLGGCKLGISRYPDFDYNAQGGSGRATGMPIVSVVSNEVEDPSKGDILACFDPKELYIPPLSSRTTRFLGLPLPPFLKIEIVPELFKGSINTQSGKVVLEFKAKFWFSMGTIYRAPPLLVMTVLTTDESIGEMRSGQGQRLDKEGKCRLVGVARVDPIDDFFMNAFLHLPTECLANLNAVMSFSNQSS